MVERNLIDELVFLARAAAEAGRDWRTKIEELLPGLVTGEAARVREALHALALPVPEDDGELTAVVLKVVAEALAEVGYD